MEINHKYGRGRFKVGPEYIQYMNMIATGPIHGTIPNAINAAGRIVWQTSSGIFKENYEPRLQWWIAKADELGLPGEGRENDRLTIAARLIHPTKYHPCRACGKIINIGYFYATANLAKRLNKEFRFLGRPFYRGQSIPSIVATLSLRFGHSEIANLFKTLFPERVDYFQQQKNIIEVFRSSLHVRCNLLSPGYMGNAPDRLDGFHEYCVLCRSRNDPGRSKSNMRRYNHDRRAFAYWAEGDWAAADTLCNSIGSGVCSVSGVFVERLSPDHIGPLSCGFKHTFAIQPVCKETNTSKNRRMKAVDVEKLIAYEIKNNESSASWQVRSLWNKYKKMVHSDDQATELSGAMRDLQDLYLKTLAKLHDYGRAFLLRQLLYPEYAFYDTIFVGLDPGTLVFSDIQKIPNKAPARLRLASRTICIAFEELQAYVSYKNRKTSHRYDWCLEYLDSFFKRAQIVTLSSHDKKWNNATDLGQSRRVRQSRVQKLLVQPQKLDSQNALLLQNLKALFKTIGERPDEKLERLIGFEIL